MLLLSLKTHVMLKMQFITGMGITLMVVDCGLNLHMVGEEIHHQWIAIVVIVVVAVAVVFRGILIIVFWSLDYLLLLHGKT